MIINDFEFKKALGLFIAECIKSKLFKFNEPMVLTLPDDWCINEFPLGEWEVTVKRLS